MLELVWALGLALLWMLTIPLQKKYSHPGLLFPRREQGKSTEKGK